MKSFNNEQEKRDYIERLLDGRLEMYMGFDKVLPSDPSPIEKLERDRKEAEEDYTRIAYFADTCKVPGKYSDYWFAWYFGDNDYWSYMEEGADVIANYFCKLYRRDVWELGYNKHLAEKTKREIDQGIIKERYKVIYEEALRDFEKSIEKCEEYVRNNTMKNLDRALVFWDKQFLMDAISHIGCSHEAIMGIKPENRFRNGEYQQSLTYMTSDKHLEHVAIGREGVWKLLETYGEHPGKEEFTLEEVSFNGGECIVVHIKDGEIKFCRAI